MVALAWRLRSVRAAPPPNGAAKRLFAFSILYLFVLFAALLVERAARLGRTSAACSHESRDEPDNRPSRASC